MDSPDVIVVGAGPSGLMCAVQAAERGLSVVVLERQELAGAKLCYSGMGAAPVTNTAIGLEHFHGRHNRFVTDALAAFPGDAMRDWFAGRGVVLEEADYYGLVHPPGGGGEVIGALVEALEQNSGELRTGARAVSVAAGDGFEVALESGEVLRAGRVVLATGGANLPQLGGSEDGYRIAGMLGHRLEPVSPAQVGLMVAEDWVRELPGLWMDVVLTLEADGRTLAETTGSMLFTRAGLVGEAAFNVSREVEPALLNEAGLTLHVNFHPGMERADVAEWMRRVFGERTRERVIQALDYIVPESLAEKFVALQKIKPTARVMQLDEKQRDEIFAAMTDTRLAVTGTLGFKAAESVRGGVRVKDVDPRSFESRLVPGLYIVGQVLDVGADWGGFEQHFALASGYLAGTRMAR